MPAHIGSLRRHLQHLLGRELIELCRDSAPVLRSDIRDILRECPSVPGVIFGSVLSHTEGHVGGAVNDASPEVFGALVVDINVFDGHMDILCNLARSWRAERATPDAEHHCSVGDRELGVADYSITTGNAQTLPKAESATEPADGLRNVAIDEDRRNGCFGCRAVDVHGSIPHSRSHAA